MVVVRCTAGAAGVRSSAASDGYKGQVGVLVGLIEPLRDAGVPVLAISTFDTDWILVDATRAAAAESAWIATGVELLDRGD